MKNYAEIAERKGIEGEERFGRFCKQITSVHPEVKFYRNLLVPTRSRNTATEIDVVCSLPQGIYSIEYKEWDSEYIVPYDLTQKHWAVYRKCMNKTFLFLSPYIQNKTHCESLKEELGVDVHNIIVIPDHCPLKFPDGRKVSGPDHKCIMNYNTFYYFLREQLEKEPIFSKETLDKINNTLFELTLHF